MHIEGVAARRALGPAGPSQLVAAHDRAEALEERRHQAGLDRRQRHPVRAEAQHTVAIELGRTGRCCIGPLASTDRPGPDVGLVGRHPDPVLEAVERPRGPAPALDEQQSRATLCCRALSTLLFERPPQEHDIHGAGR